MIILNLGCGTQTSPAPEVINIDWSIALRIRRNRSLRAIAPIVMRGGRLMRFKKLPDNIKVWDLSRGIPFDSDTIDAVYHSHMLEHLDRDVARQFLLECKRVLKPGGIVRIVVLDFEILCQKYLSHIADCEYHPDEAKNHEQYIASIIEQSVRKEAWGTSQQRPLRRFIENLVLGDDRKRGETHQWMYDRISLKSTLNELGYNHVFEQKYDTSKIPHWTKFELDVDENGKQYKPDSLYLEAMK